MIQPSLRRFVLIPLLVNMVLFTVLITVAVDGFDALMGFWIPQGDTLWLTALRGLLWVVFAALSLLILFLTFSAAANLIGAPFNGILAERVEIYLAGPQAHPPAQGWRELLTGAVPALLNECRKLAYFTIVGALVLILYLIPVLNVLFPLAWLLFGAWMLALEYLAYPMENHGFTLSQVRKAIKSRRLTVLGFGLCASLLTMIPIVNFFIMPAAVAGATALWTEQRRYLAPDGAEAPRPVGR